MSDSSYELRDLKISSQNKNSMEQNTNDIKECLKLLFISIEDIKNNEDIDYQYVTEQLENYIFMLENVLEHYYNFCSDKFK